MKVKIKFSAFNPKFINSLDEYLKDPEFTKDSVLRIKKDEVQVVDGGKASKSFKGDFNLQYSALQDTSTPLFEKLSENYIIAFDSELSEVIVKPI